MAFENYPSAQLALLDEDFLVQLAEQERTPEDVLGSFSAADKCERPLEVETFYPANHASAGQPAGYRRMACNSKRASICRPCAERYQKMNLLRLMTVQESAGGAVFVTRTAESWGQVHQVTWKPDDEAHLRATNASEDELPELRDEAMRSKAPCVCGGFHDWKNDLAGAPLRPDEYRYESSVIWAQNYPNLMRSFFEQVFRIAKKVGIPVGQTVWENGFKVKLPNHLHAFAVQERQIRAELHAHCLFVVHQDSAHLLPTFHSELSGLVADETRIATARIPEEMMDYYRAVPEAGNSQYDATKHVTRGLWKGRNGVPLTRFGRIGDVQLVQPEIEEGAETSYLQVASYLVKYLSKGSYGFHPDEMRSYQGARLKHYQKLRATALHLLGPWRYRMALEGLFQERERQLTSEGVWNVSLDRSAVLSTVPFGLLAHAETQAITRTGLRPFLAGETFRDRLRAALRVEPDQENSYFERIERRVKLNLNKLADNAGHTGSLAQVRNWPLSMAELKAQRQAFYLATHPDEEREDYEFGPVTVLPVITVAGEQPADPEEFDRHELRKAACKERVLHALRQHRDWVQLRQPSAQLPSTLHITLDGAAGLTQSLALARSRVDPDRSEEDWYQEHEQSETRQRIDRFRHLLPRGPDGDESIWFLYLQN